MINYPYISLHEILDSGRFSPDQVAEVQLAFIENTVSENNLPLIRAAFEDLHRLEQRSPAIDMHLMNLGGLLRQSAPKAPSDVISFPEFFAFYMAFHRHARSLQAESKLEDAKPPKKPDPHEAYKIFRYFRSPNLKEEVLHLTRVVQGGPYPFKEMTRELRDALVLLYVAGFSWPLIDQVFPGVFDEYYSRSHTVSKNSYQDDSRFGYPWYAFELPVVTEDDSFHEAMQIRPGHVVLDPLTGTARNLIPLARKYHLTQFVGLDINPENLRESVGEARRNRFSFDRVWFGAQDAFEPYDLANDSIDRIVINNYSTFGFSQDQLRHFFSEMGRLLKPTGRLWLDFVPYASPTGNDMRQSLINTWLEEDILFHKISVDGNWKNSDRVSVFEIVHKEHRSEMIVPSKRRLALHDDHVLNPRTRVRNARVQTTPFGWRGKA